MVTENAQGKTTHTLGMRYGVAGKINRAINYGGVNDPLYRVRLHAHIPKKAVPRWQQTHNHLVVGSKYEAGTLKLPEFVCLLT